MVDNSSAFGIAPLALQSASPLRNSMRVGMDWIWYCRDSAACVSTSILMIRIRSPNTSFNLLQDGVHHFAGLAPGCKEIDQHELIASYYVVKCFHSYCVFCLLLVEK